MLQASFVMLLQLAAAGRPEDERALHDAREAQERFEFTRRAHLPRGFSGGPARCDAQIGRYCYWHDGSDVRPAEPARIIQARRDLIAALDSAARRAPANRWIAGQRVRYLIEGAQFAAAQRAASECRAEPWWCHGLSALAFHVEGRNAAAGTVFDAALAAMPPPQRCAWFDLEQLTTGAVRKSIRDGDCVSRIAAAERLWALSQPLWSTAGNDLRNEHFARQMMAQVLMRSVTASGMTFGDDSRELLIRYGWPEWFTRREEPYAPSGQVTGHDREPSYRFFPDLATIDDRWIPRAAWRLRDTAALTRYAPRHVTWMGELAHQLARFPRGDSMLVVVATRVRDPELAGDQRDVALTLRRGASQQTVRGRDSAAIVATLPRDTLIASIEVLGERSKRAERSRYSVAALPCDSWCLSDLLLFTARDSARDVPLEAAARAAIAEKPVSASAGLGIYWETEGVERLPLSFALTIEPLRVSTARRVAAALRLAREPAAVRLRWDAVSEQRAQSIVVRLPPSARGRYRVHLAVRPRGAHAALSATREIELTR